MPRRLEKVAFIPTEVSGVNFYRVWQPAEALRALGHPVAVLWYQSNKFLRDNWEMDLAAPAYYDKITGDIEKACQWADVVVWMAIHTPQSMALWRQMRLRYPYKPFVMEMDDNLLSVPDYNPGSEVYNHGNDLTIYAVEQARKSDALVVSTPNLKEVYSAYNDNIHVVENVIDSALWRGNTSPARHRVNIGWVGGGTHGKDLEIVKDVIFETLAKHKNVRFFCLHGTPRFFKHKPGCAQFDRPLNEPPCLECNGYPGIEWTHDFKAIKDYPKWVTGHKFDIGIAPLVDNAFNRGKSNLRWLEYSVQGIPTVASNVGHFKETLRHGETGFLVNTEEEWLHALDRLLDDSALRNNIGKNARREVLTNWSPKSLGRKYKTVIREIVNAKHDAVNACDPHRRADRRSEQYAVVGV